MSLANCFKIGTATHNDIRNVTLKDSFFFMAGIAGGYAGIAIESTDGATVSGIKVQNIKMEHVTSPLLIWLGYRKDGAALSDVGIENIEAIGCDLPSAVVGYRNSDTTAYVRNVTLKNISVTYREAAEKLHIYRKDSAYEGKLNMGGYPEITRVSHKYLLNHELSAYYDLPVYGLYARYVDGLSVEDFSVTPRSANTRPHDNVREEGSRNHLNNVTWA